MAGICGTDFTKNSSGAYKHGEYIAKQIASRYVQYNYNVDEYVI